MHKDQTLHFLSLIRAPRVDFTQDDTMLMGKIPSLLLNYNIERPDLFAQRLFELVEAYPPYAKISRFCIAKRLGLANALQVISSEQKSGMPNTLNAGYSCFVKPDSTLLKLKATDIRIFSDAKEVVRAFADNGQPPQRSIQRIAAAGNQSGLCMPLFRGAHNFAYLFINSQDNSLSSLRPIDYCILTYIQSVTALAHLQQDQVSDSYYSLAAGLTEDYIGCYVSEDALFGSLQRHLRILGHKVELNNEGIATDPYLFSPGNLANIISRYAWILNARKLGISIAESSATRLALQINHQDSIAPSDRTFFIKAILDDCQALGIEATHVSTSKLMLSIDRDRGQLPFPYSVDGLGYQ